MVQVHSFICATALLFYFADACPSLAQEPLTNFSSASASDAAQSSDVVTGMVQESRYLMDSGDLDGALSGVDSALQIDPHNASAFDLRGAIYIQKKLWDRAENDYTTALAISPDNTAFKYKLAEIKFLQKAYDDARPRYAALVNDQNYGDLAAYKAYLCDLFGGHDERASAELAAFNKVGAYPSYYYANAAWGMAHNNLKDANNWVRSAQQIFDSLQNEPYLSCLVNINGLKPTIVSFTSKSGDTYDQVKAFVEDDGLRVATAQGWTTLPFDQLPDDLSPFPAAMRKQILSKRALASESKTHSELVGFTSRQGEKYDQVRVAIDDNGLQVLTPAGWTTLPFAQLPDDLSAFPDDLRKQISVKRENTPVSTGDARTLTFTTRQGKVYDQVRVTIEEDGLLVLTPDGWIIVPFAQLPEDLAPFPADLRKQILAKRRASTVAGTPTKLISFTTKDGKNYDHVRLTVENNGLQVLTERGWITVPFDQLPADLSPFPSDVRDQIVSKRQSLAGTSSDSKWVSFTTKKGRFYDQVRVKLEDNGLQALTPDGWITIPLAQLPDDLSPFPDGLREDIVARRKALLAKSSPPSTSK